MGKSQKMIKDFKSLIQYQLKLKYPTIWPFLKTSCILSLEYFSCQISFFNSQNTVYMIERSDFAPLNAWESINDAIKNPCLLTLRRRM